MQFFVGIGRRFGENFLLFPLVTRVFCWVRIGFLELWVTLKALEWGKISVAKKDSKIEGLAISALFTAK